MACLRFSYIVTAILFIIWLSCVESKDDKKELLSMAIKTIPDEQLNLYEKSREILDNANSDYGDIEADKELQYLFSALNVSLLSGPMLGCITHHSVKLKVRTTKPASVYVRVRRNHWTKKYGPVVTTVSDSLTAVILITGLEPSTEYRYEVLVDNNVAMIPESARILTAPSPNTKERFRIAFGADQHIWGLANQRQSDLVRKRNAIAILLLGDIAVQDERFKAHKHQTAYMLRDFFPAFKSMVASVPVYAVWDDHDYYDNDYGGIPKGETVVGRNSILKVFKDSWINPFYGLGGNAGGIFFKTSIGPIDVIMLDNRFFRGDEKNPGDNRFLGEAQLEWLLNTLLECDGAFIILCSPSMWTDYVSDGKDSWGALDPKGREAIFSLIEKNRIPGVLLISGDRHGSRAFIHPRPSGYTFYEFEQGSLGGRSGPPARPKDAKDVQLYGQTGSYAFGEFTFDTSLEDPEVHFRSIKDNGEAIYEIKLTRSQLTPTDQQTKNPTKPPTVEYVPKKLPGCKRYKNRMMKEKFKQDIANLVVYSFDECQRLCSSVNCVTFEYDRISKNCFILPRTKLKTDDMKKSDDFYIFSCTEDIPKKLPGCKRYQNQMMKEKYKHGIDSLVVSSFDECQSFCSSANCITFEYDRISKNCFILPRTKLKTNDIEKSEDFYTFFCTEDIPKKLPGCKRYKNRMMKEKYKQDIDNLVVSSFVECQNLCSSANCVTFEYDRINKNCFVWKMEMFGIKGNTEKSEDAYIFVCPS